ncbi:hypothetical protein ANN_09825 [Periplaneta americana]|uniref:Uncharacterized protein n=1 Tax=Periplaneta americana TaxID=6978 RepID=A0ABQ8TP48_PERAM|nr:hypothetical protein ANN_09825 [Periplaneta americana]
MGIRCGLVDRESARRAENPCSNPVPERIFLRSSHPSSSKSKHGVSDQWIGRGEPIGWPARSPDLEFCVRYHLKSLMYETPIESEEELIARVLTSADSLHTWLVSLNVYDRQ